METPVLRPAYGSGVGPDTTARVFLPSLPPLHVLVPPKPFSVSHIGTTLARLPPAKLCGRHPRVPPPSLSSHPNRNLPVGLGSPGLISLREGGKALPPLSSAPSPSSLHFSPLSSAPPSLLPLSLRLIPCRVQPPPNPQSESPSILHRSRHLYRGFALAPVTAPPNPPSHNDASLPCIGHL